MFFPSERPASALERPDPVIHALRGRIKRPDPDLARSKPLKSWIKPSIPWPGQGPTQASLGLSWAFQGMAGVPQGLAWAPKSQAWASHGLTWPCMAWLEPLRVWLGPPRAWLGPPRTPIEPPKGLNWDYDGHWTDIWMDGQNEIPPVFSTLPAPIW